MNHTKGPWTIGKINPLAIMKNDKHITCCTYYKEITNKEQQANAKLIATSPELLETLIEVNRIDTIEELRAFKKEIINVIKKATE